MKRFQELIACYNRSLDTFSPASQKMYLSFVVIPLYLEFKRSCANTSSAYERIINVLRITCINIIFLTIVEFFVWTTSRSARERLTELHVDFIGFGQHPRRDTFSASSM